MNMRAQLMTPKRHDLFKRTYETNTKTEQNKVFHTFVQFLQHFPANYQLGFEIFYKSEITVHTITNNCY